MQGINNLTVTGNALIGTLGIGAPIRIKTFNNQSFGSLSIASDATFESTLNGSITAGNIDNMGGAGTDLSFLTEDVPAGQERALP